MDNHAYKVGLGETGNTASTGGGITQGVRNFIQGRGVGDSTVWVEDVGPFGNIGEEGGRDTHWVPSADHGEASEAVKRRDMGDAWGGRRTAGSGNSVGEDLHRDTVGNLGSVGGATSSI